MSRLTYRMWTRYITHSDVADAMPWGSLFWNIPFTRYEKVLRSTDEDVSFASADLTRDTFWYALCLLLVNWNWSICVTTCHKYAESVSVLYITTVSSASPSDICNMVQEVLVAALTSHELRHVLDTTFIRTLGSFCWLLSVLDKMYLLREASRSQRRSGKKTSLN